MQSLHDVGGDAPAVVRWMAKIEVGLGAVLMLAALAVTITTIVERNLGHSTGEWSLKLPELMLMWLTLQGSPLRICITGLTDTGGSPG